MKIIAIKNTNRMSFFHDFGRYNKIDFFSAKNKNPILSKTESQ